MWGPQTAVELIVFKLRTIAAHWRARKFAAVAKVSCGNRPQTAILFRLGMGPQSAELRPQDVLAHFLTNFLISDRDATFSVRDRHSTGEIDWATAVELLGE